MIINETLQILAIAIGVIVAIAVLVGNVYYVIRTKNYKLQEEKLNHCNDQHAESQTQIDTLKHNISNLQGQVATLRDIPLHDIKDGIKSLVKITGKTLDLLGEKALIDAEDRDVLTNSNKHIRTEVQKEMRK